MEVRWYLPEAEDFQQDRDDGTGSRESFSSCDITRKYRNQRNPDDDGSGSEQNLAEMRIRRVRDKATRAIFDKNLPLDPFEHYAYRNALILTNLQTTAPLMGRTPYQEYDNKNPARALNRIRPFGTIAYYLPPNKTKHDKAK